MGKIVTQIFSAILVITLTAFVTYQIAFGNIEKKYSETVFTLAEETTSFSKLNAIDALVRKEYVHDIDEEELENWLIYGYLYGIGDKYATYLDAEEYQKYINQSNGKSVGIGINIIYDTTMGGFYVTDVQKDSPAMETGLMAGDVIYAVDNENISDRGYYDTINYITDGKVGDPVTVSVKKGNDPSQTVDYIIKRAELDLTTVEHELYGGKVGYVRISDFNHRTPDEFITAMEDLAKLGAESYVFDVRNNSGGSLDSIGAILDYLLPEGPIIRIFSKNSGEVVINSDAECIEAPMAVLVNGSTASAAELFSSALRDYNKAKLIGETTYGKGTLQTMLSLSEDIGGGALYISTGMYNPPYSDNYEDKGISPDIVLPLPEEQAAIFYKLTLREDSQFQEALKTIVNTETLVFDDAEDTAEDKNE